MKKLKSLPACVLDQIKNDHQRAMDQVFRDAQFSYRLPMHVVAMRVLNENRGTSIESVIIPDVVIHLTKKSFVTPDTLDCHLIRYSLQRTHQPFPFGHVFKTSGNICLGDIFVPSLISCHAPQQPLETLFLYNDRNVNHGGSVIFLSAQQITQITQYLTAVAISVPDTILARLKPDYNLVCNDAIWVLSSHVLKTSPTNALTVMSHIFDIVFTLAEHR